MNGEKPINRDEREGRCILICAGDLTIDKIKVGEGDLCIAVDGGFLYSSILGVKPDYIIGDFDSVDERVLSEIARIEREEKGRVIRLDPRKDDTDTLSSLRKGLELGYRDFRIYAATGGRVEHTIANIQCLTFLKKNGAAGYLMDAETMMFVIRDESIHFKKDVDGYLSLFSLGDQAEGVTIKGMKYPLEDYLMSNDYPIGVSNEFIGEQGEISVKKGTLLVVLSWS